MRTLAAALLVTIPFTASLTAQEATDSGWPHWRGPARDGVSLETDWSPVGAPTPLWRLEVGLGYSNVAIRGGRLYTLGFDEGAGLDRLVCVDAETGREHWRQEWPAEIRANFHGGGTLTTPTVDGDVVFVSNREGKCFALRAADGERLWAQDYTERLGLTITFHGYSASPLALPDRLVLVLGGKVLAVDKASGDVLWQTEDHGDGGYSNPVPFELDGERRLAVFLGVGLFVFDTETGAELHRFDWKPKAGGVNVSTPIVFGRRIFISSAYNQGSALLELGADPEPKQLWRSRRMRNKVSGCTLWEDHIYGFDESMLKCIDLDGEEKWRVRGLGMGSVAVAGGRLIVLTSKGELIVGAASPDGFEELSRQSVLSDGVYWTTPVLLDGRIYCRNSLGHLVALDHRSAAGVASADVHGAGQDAGSDLPDADGLFEAHAAATGGEALRARRSLHLEGTIEILGDGVTRTSMVVDQIAPDRWRLAYDVGQFGTFVRCFDGEIGWRLDPFEGDELVEGDALREQRELRRLHAPLEWRQTYAPLRTSGRAEFGGHACWVVTGTSKGGAKRRFYFDATTGRMVGHSGAGESMVVYAEWREFEGVSLPTRTTVIAPDTGAEETRIVERVTWDSVDPAVFERPAAVARLLRTPEEVEALNRAARERYARYLGGYRGELPNGAARWTIQVADGDLAVESEAMGVQALVPGDGEHAFTFRGSPAFRFEFRIGAGDAVEGLVFHARGQEFEFTRDD